MENRHRNEIAEAIDFFYTYVQSTSPVSPSSWEALRGIMVENTAVKGERILDYIDRKSVV